MPKRHNTLKVKLRLQRLMADHLRKQLTTRSKRGLSYLPVPTRVLPCGNAHSFLVDAGRQRLSS